MTSEEHARVKRPAPAPGDAVHTASLPQDVKPGRGANPRKDTSTGESGNPGRDAEPRQAASEPGGRRERLDLTDPKAIRAMAHPLRWALLEALGQAGTLTATQASEMLGESPANCAFHLRTLAKYGFVEEAGGGRGRERPWRPAFNRLSWPTRHEDPQFSHAAEALDQVWMDRLLTRARRSLTSRTSWPEAFGEEMGASSSRLYVTPEEARELHAEMEKTVPVEFVLLGYPVLDSPPLPEADEGGDDPDAEPEAGPPG
jgi:hypothetical protein